MQEFNFDAYESYAKIVVIGVGGAGNNAVNQMIEEKIANIDFWVVNTDAQALATSRAEHKYVLGKDYTKGLGAGGNPEIGKNAAESSLDDLKEIVAGANMVFIAAGMGGGTGTGAAPVIARIAKESGALTVAIVTRPFTFEGNNRKVKAVEGLNELKKEVDSIIIVSNDKLMMINGNKSIAEAFAESDRVLAQSVKTITDLILLPGLINLDFADVKATLMDKGVALIGFGMGSGERKAMEAATNAIASPLLEASIKGRSQRDHQRHRRKRRHAGRNAGSHFLHHRSRRRERQHHLRRSAESGTQRSDADQRDRDGLRRRVRHAGSAVDSAGRQAGG